MLEYNEIKPKTFIELDGEPYEVLSSHVFRKQQRKPVNQTKIKNLITGKVAEHSFHQSEKVEEAEIKKRQVKYLYNNRDEIWFCDINNLKERFSLDEEIAGDQLKFMKGNLLVDLLSFNEKVIGLEIPIKVELKVIDAPPNVKGNTAQGANKQVTLETGAIITVPMFVTEGETIIINTQTGDYVERV